MIIIDDNDALIAQTSAELTVSIPQLLWSEQAPQDWWQATNEAMAELNNNHAKALLGVQAIGLSGQMHGATLLDATHDIIRPAILWHDSRSQQQCL